MRSGLCIALSACLSLALVTGAAAAPDPCSLLTPAQVGAAVGTPVGAGVGTSTGHTCTWKATDGGASGVVYATLFLQSCESYEAGRKVATQMGGQAAVPVSGVGDSAYYFVTGSTAGLLARKGGSAFKAAVYGSAPLEKKKAMEKALASAVVGKL